MSSGRNTGKNQCFLSCEADLKKVKIVRREEANLANLIGEAKRTKEISECGGHSRFHKIRQGKSA